MIHAPLQLVSYGAGFAGNEAQCSLSPCAVWAPCLGFSGSGVPDLVARRDAIGAASWQQTPFGPAIQAPAAGMSAGPATWLQNSPYSIAALCKPIGPNGSNSLFGAGATWPRLNAHITPTIYYDSGWQRLTLAAPGNLWGNWHTLVFTASCCRMEVFCDGRSLGWANQSGFYTGSDEFLIGSFAANWFYGPIALLAVFRRAVTAAEAVAFHGDPLAILRPRRRRVYAAHRTVGGPYHVEARGAFGTGAIMGQDYHTGPIAGTTHG